MFAFLIIIYLPLIFHMRHNIFTSTKHWNFTESDETAEEKFKSIEAEARDSLPGNFYQRPLVHLKLIEQTRLYQLMRTIPKGVLHHLHYFCSDDEHFVHIPSISIAPISSLIRGFI
jgi:hypothetical protein